MTDPTQQNWRTDAPTPPSTTSTTTASATGATGANPYGYYPGGSYVPRGQPQYGHGATGGGHPSYGSGGGGAGYAAPGGYTNAGGYNAYSGGGGGYYPQGAYQQYGGSNTGGYTHGGGYNARGGGDGYSRSHSGGYGGHAGYTQASSSSASASSSSSGLEGFTIKRKEKKKKGKKGKKKRGGAETSTKKFAKGAMLSMPIKELATETAATTGDSNTTSTDTTPTAAPVPPKASSEEGGGGKKVRKTKPKKEAETVEPAKPKPVVVDDSDPREHLNVVFIGHVDAGKSTISGQVLFQTGMVDKRTIKKFEKEAKDLNRESWFLAFVMDTSEEERAKGKTVEVGRATFETKKRRFTVLDAPGHSNYVPNMIAGASQADVGVLVISARKGEFEAGFDRSGQTREHAMLAKTLGVNKLIVVVNKMDEPTVKWSKKRFDEIQTALKPFLRKFCGFKLRKDVSWVPMSGLTGQNLKDKVDPKVCPWNESEPLLSVLEKLTMDGRDATKPLRVPILDKYVDRGVIAMGKVECGTLIKGQTITIQPTGIKAIVEGLWVDGPEDGKEVNVAKPGENIRVRLKGVMENQMHKGFVLCDENTGKGVKVIDAKMTVLQLLKHRQLLSAGYKAVLHCHTVAEEVTVMKILSKGVGEKKEKRPKFVKSQKVCVVRLMLDRKICVERFEDVAQLGVFTLRDERQTIAVGRVLKILK
eukprot:g3328.t1